MESEVLSNETGFSCNVRSQSPFKKKKATCNRPLSTFYRLPVLDQPYVTDKNQCLKDQERVGETGTSSMPRDAFVLGSAVSRSYRFCGHECSNSVRVEETMFETRLSFRVPISYLKICIKKEEAKIRQLEELGELSGGWENIRENEISAHTMYLHRYHSRLKFLNEQYEADASFKKSVDKTIEGLDFVATNLHLQQMKVENVYKRNLPKSNNFRSRSSAFYLHEDPNLSKTSFRREYNFITVGAASAHAMGFKQGGLLSQLANADEGSKGKNNLPLQAIGHCLKLGHSQTEDNNLLRRLENLRNKVYAQIDKLSETLKEDLLAVAPGCCSKEKATQLSNLLAVLSERISQFIAYCDSEAISSRVIDLATSRPLYGEASTASEGIGQGCPLDKLDSISSIPDNSSANQTSPHEQWENKNLSVNLAFIDVTEVVNNAFSYYEESAIKGKEDEHQEAMKALQRLRALVAFAAEEAIGSITFSGLKQQDDNIDKDLQYRRKSVFSQALSLCIAGVTSAIGSSLHDQSVLHQYAEVGILLQVESLLSTYGNEQGMLQDYAVGIYDLSNVKFKCVRASDLSNEEDAQRKSDEVSETFLPSLCERSDELIVSLPFNEDSFKFLPENLQKGKLIQVCPVIFNIGINEEQTLAQNFGNTSLQEYLNMEAMKRIMGYYELVQEKCPTVITEQTQSEDVLQPEISAVFISIGKSKLTPSIDTKNGDAQRPLEDCLNSLSASVHSKKAKNTEVLHLAAEVCRRMHGVRVISCKSAKDRTAMAVTLEQARILKDNHGMAHSMFNQALNCMRSKGTRIENTFKNTGARKYAFASVQLLTFPKLYRPPEGTYGKGET